MQPEREPVVVLTSGGIDSTALIHYFRSQGNKVLAVHVQYGQPSAVAEQEAADRVASYYHIPARTLHTGFNLRSQQGEFLCRNALLVLIALAEMEGQPARVALGIHAGSPYYDCTEHFANDLQRIIDGYFAGSIALSTPFLFYTKGDIVAYCRQQGVPLDLTYSCERQSNQPCGTCPSCRERERYYAS